MLLSAQGFGVNRYVFENHRAALDAPGQWFLGRERGASRRAPVLRRPVVRAGRLHRAARWSSRHAGRHTSFTYAHNIVWWIGGPALKGDWTHGLALRASDCFDTKQTPAAFLKVGFDAWKPTAVDQGSIFADPKLVDPAHGDFTLRSKSPAIANGFKPFPLDQRASTATTACELDNLRLENATR